MIRCALICILLFAVQHGAAQEAGGWCGYALVEGLPLLENQLAVLAAITPAKSESSRPNELFQFRYNLAYTAVLIEGCWRVEPTRDMVISLLSQAVRYDDRMIDLIGGIGAIGNLGEPVEAGDVVRAYIDKVLIYTIFEPGKTAEESAAAVRAYLAANIRDWEEPEGDRAPGS